MVKMVFRQIDVSTLVNTANTPDKFLHGTGVTKKEVAKGVKISLKGEAASLEANAKQDISKRALALLEAEAQESANVLEIKRPDALQLDQYQSAAVEGANENMHLCIIGAAGTGKTTIETQVIEKIVASIPEIDIEKTSIKKKNDDGAPLTGIKVYSLAVIAFTGKAVQQSKRSLPKKYHLNCMTGHRCLEYAPTMELRDDIKNPGTMKEIRVFKPQRTEFNKLPYDLIIIEEASMFPVKLFNELMAAAKPGCRFIFIGDINQLPPVQDTSVLPFAMLKYPTFELKHIHRQAADNPIIKNAHRILQGLMPEPDPKHFYMKNISDGSTTAASDVLRTVKILHQKGVFDPIRDALIVQSNKKELGQLYLNSDLIHYFNPPKKDSNGVILNRRVAIKAARGTRLLAIGDKVMQLENDNDLELTNGMIGVVVDITRNGDFRDKHVGGYDMPMADVSFGEDEFELEAEEPDDGSEEETKEDKEREKDENQRQASHITTIKFASTDEDIECKLQTVGQYNKIAHAYAMTCHKSQGSEYPHVMVVFHTALARMLTREWLYTAVTRARERVFMFYNNRALTMALKNQAIKGQTIEEKANSFLAWIDDPDRRTPNLPPAARIVK